MKKSIFIISFIFIALFFSFSYVSANTTEGNMMNELTNSEAGHAIENKAGDIKGAVKEGFNTTDNNPMNEARDSAEKMRNEGRFMAERTATTVNNDENTRNLWAWITIGVVAVVIIGLIWYYTARHNDY